MADVFTEVLVVDGAGARRELQLTAEQLKIVANGGREAEAILKKAIPPTIVPPQTVPNINRVTEAMRRMRDAAAASQANAMASMIKASDPFQQQAVSMAKATVEAEKHHFAIGRVNLALEGLAVESIGVNSRLASIAAKFAEFGVGGAATGAILAGLAAGAFAWEKFTESTRKANEETAKAIGRLEELRKDQLGGPSGRVGGDVTQAVIALGKVRGEIMLTEASLKGFAENSGDIYAVRLRGVLKTERDSESLLLAQVRAGKREQAKIEADAEAEAQRQREEAKRKREAAYSEEIRALQILMDKERVLLTARGKAQEAAVAFMRDLGVKAAAAVAKSHPLSTGLGTLMLPTISDADIEKVIQQRKDADDAVKQHFKDTLRDMRDASRSFFEDLVTNGIRSFDNLFGSIRAGFTSLIADVAARRLSESMAGYIGMAATSTTADRKSVV